MANSPSINGGLDNWNPGPGGAFDPKKAAALMSTEAHDNPDSINATNKLERFDKSTGSGKPKGPFGTQGKMF